MPHQHSIAQHSTSVTQAAQCGAMEPNPCFGPRMLASLYALATHCRRVPPFRCPGRSLRTAATQRPPAAPGSAHAARPGSLRPVPHVHPPPGTTAPRVACMPASHPRNDTQLLIPCMPPPARQHHCGSYSSCCIFQLRCHKFGTSLVSCVLMTASPSRRPHRLCAQRAVLGSLQRLRGVPVNPRSDPRL